MSDEALLERPVAETTETRDATVADDVSPDAAPLFCSPVLDRIRACD